MENIEKQKIEMENAKKEQIKEQSLIKKEKENRFNFMKIKQENENKMKVSQILTKFNQTEDKLVERRKSTERELMIKHETSNMKRFEKEVILKRICNIQEYNKEQILNTIKDKMERFEMIQEQKEQINKKRKQVSEEINKQKIEIMEKFDKILKKNRGVAVNQKK